MKVRSDRLPILHISAHGNDKGIGLSDGTIVTWNDLRALIGPINKALNELLVLCLSACRSAIGCSMAMSLTERPPFFAVVGTYDSPTWSETAVAFASFYHLLAKGKTIPDAVEAMNVAAGVKGFVSYKGEETQKGFLEYVVEQYNATRARERLEEAAETAQPSQEVSALEGTPNVVEPDRGLPDAVSTEGVADAASSEGGSGVVSAQGVAGIVEPS
jgi:hypothetical protein